MTLLSISSGSTTSERLFSEIGQWSRLDENSRVLIHSMHLYLLVTVCDPHIHIASLDFLSKLNKRVQLNIQIASMDRVSVEKLYLYSILMSTFQVF